MALSNNVSMLRSTPGLLVSHTASALLLALVVSCTRSFDNRHEAMAFYGVFHQTPFDQLIHFVGVPLIIFTVLIFQSHLRIVGTITWATLTTLFYVIFYLSIDPIGAILYTPVLYLMHSTAQSLVDFDQEDYRLGVEERAYRQKKRDREGENKAVSNVTSTIIPWYGTGRMLYYALGLHLLAWYVQIHPGHLVTEGGRPALATSLGVALTTAPLFAFYEGLWFLGLRKEFHKEVLAQVEQKTREMCRAGEKMRICETFQGLGDLVPTRMAEHDGKQAVMLN